MNDPFDTVRRVPIEKQAVLDLLRKLLNERMNIYSSKYICTCISTNKWSKI